MLIISEPRLYEFNAAWTVAHDNGLVIGTIIVFEGDSSNGFEANASFIFEPTARNVKDSLLAEILGLIEKCKQEFIAASAEQK